MLEDLRRRVEELKRRRKAIILAHNYTLPEVQEVADFVGDSLELAKAAMRADADVIVFAGVSFMAELAKALNMDRIVLHANPCAGCPLADHAKPSELREAKASDPRAPLLVYVNSPLTAKAEADFVVTSSSAPRVAEALAREGVERILLSPDRNLADHVAQVAGVEVVPVPPTGRCPVHEDLVSPYYLRRALEENPGAVLAVHPEAPRASRRMAAFIGSTSQMLEAIPRLASMGSPVLLGTEEGLAWRARRLHPSVDVRPANPLAVCIDMKKNTLLHIVEALERMKWRVEVDPNTARRAREAMEATLSVLRGR